MSSSANNSGAAYPSPPHSTAPSPYFVQAPPPAGYPTRDGPNPHGHAAVETKSKGDGFWKGCCAALCCCCVLDACF
ncbi:cysteine-rich and transmembrane domain-containing protein WIH2-like [Prunus dulcis]|uniref:cysteine-rich and transmembrane domain-containing protein WIH2-like n=1 Tax=Prunus dulcis TaxID=3755 RepID=UPI00148323AC|nr:cysteine-rich and transmembrane domain-containing protein WIH2-like [Prunus dulcis]